MVVGMVTPTPDLAEQARGARHSGTSRKSTFPLWSPRSRVERLVIATIERSGRRRCSSCFAPAVSSASRSTSCPAVRRPGPVRRGRRRRGDHPAGHPSSGPVGVQPGSQAHHGRRRRADRLPPGAALPRGHRGRHQARLTRPRVVHAVAYRPRREALPARQVPDDGADAEAQREELLDQSKDANWLHLEHDPRITRVGRWLRRPAWTSCPSCGTSCAGR